MQAYLQTFHLLPTFLLWLDCRKAPCSVQAEVVNRLVTSIDVCVLLYLTSIAVMPSEFTLVLSLMTKSGIMTLTDHGEVACHTALSDIRMAYMLGTRMTVWDTRARTPAAGLQ